MKRILVVGGVAGGASAAARIRRLDETASITILERGPHISFSNCALPYYLGGVVASEEKLIMMAPDAFQARYQIEVRVEHEALSINPAEKTVSVKDIRGGRVYSEGYDVLILSPGARPVIPASIKGTGLPHVFTIRNVVDIARIKGWIDQENVEDVAVIGGGFIGMEVAENLRHKHVTLVEAANQVMAPFDYDMAQILHKECMDHGVDLILQDGLDEIAETEIHLRSGRKIRAQAVILAIGAAPETGLAKDAGLEIGPSGGIKVNQRFQTSDSSIYAVGDAIEVYHALTHRPVLLPLAGPAQRQARAAADSICGVPHGHPGVIGSCAVRIFDLNAAATGLNEKTAKAAGIPYDFVYIIPSDRPGSMPEAKPMHFKLLYEVPTGRILGAQAIGGGSADKRIDVIAAMISSGANLEDLKELELCYSPRFGTAKDVVNQAAMVALNILYGTVRQVPVTAVRELVESQACIIDVREEAEFQKGHLLGAKNIPLSQLRGRVHEIPNDQPVYLHCRTSQRSYFALMALQGRGFQNLWNISGSYLGICLYEYFNDVVQNRKPIVTAYNFQ
ncbi:MAG: FAD-dependent oxidoreductase [Lawsonibacter sp.]|nr:FAD-dependent oxidoreductase [Lawsonibacter sp.]